MKYFILILISSVLFGCTNTDVNRYILVRHAEKQLDVKKDPELTEAGKERAKHLAVLLAKSDITKIYSSNYKRTLMTAKPLAKELGLTIEIYDPRKLELFAKMLEQESGTALIVGHSNTTPQLTRLLSGKKVEDMDESQYSDVYIVTSLDDTKNVLRLSSDK